MTTVVTCAPPASTTAQGLAAIKARQQAMWASGDFAVVGTTLQIVGEQICEAVDLRSTDKVDAEPEHVAQLVRAMIAQAEK